METKVNMKHVFFLAMVIAFASACGGGDKADIAPVVKTDSLLLSHVRVTTLAASSGAQPIEITAIVGTDSEAKPSFKIGGVIQTISIKEGDMVRAGQLLGTLNMAEIDAQTQQAEQALAKAERDLQRAQNLFKDSVATLEMVQNATTGVEIARKTIDIAKFNRTYAEVRAPISGKVMKLIQRQGEIVGPGMPICFILGASAADWKLHAGLTDRDWSRVKVGDMASIRFDAYPGEIIAAKITDVAVNADPTSGTFDIEMTPSRRDLKLAAGLVGRASIMPTVKTNRQLLPIEALVESNGVSAVVLINENGVARRKTVQIKQLLGSQVDIASGLNLQDEVITQGAAFLIEGERIIVLR
jgi:membrane fusion protein, multidrug efflux system